MVTWRVGRNYSRTCPACPRTPSYCLNSMEETTNFLVTDTIWAVYETQCEGLTPDLPTNWYKKNPSSNWGYVWDLIFSYNPGGTFPTAVESFLNPQPAGCYKVEYNGYSTEFTIGGVDCTDYGKILVVGGIALVAGIVLLNEYYKGMKVK